MRQVVCAARNEQIAQSCVQIVESHFMCGAWSSQSGRWPVARDQSIVRKLI